MQEMVNELPWTPANILAEIWADLLCEVRKASYSTYM